MQELQIESLGQDVPWRRKWQFLQYSSLEDLMDREAQQATVHKLQESDTT